MQSTNSRFHSKNICSCIKHICIEGDLVRGIKEDIIDEIVDKIQKYLDDLDKVKYPEEEHFLRELINAIQYFGNKNGGYYDNAKADQQTHITTSPTLKGDASYDYTAISPTVEYDYYDYGAGETGYHVQQPDTPLDSSLLSKLINLAVIVK